MAPATRPRALVVSQTGPAPVGDHSGSLLCWRQAADGSTECEPDSPTAAGVQRPVARRTVSPTRQTGVMLPPPSATGWGPPVERGPHLACVSHLALAADRTVMMVRTGRMAFPNKLDPMVMVSRRTRRR